MQPSFLSSDARQVEAALTACGYRVSGVSPWLDVSLPMGSAIGLQFGDLMTVGDGGRPQLKLRGAFQVNGDLTPSAGMARSTFEKRYELLLPHAADLLVRIDLQLALKDDLRLPDDLREARAAIQTAQTYRYLLDLVADLRQTLKSFPVSSVRKGWSGPGLRLEARVLADLTMGRTGVIRPCPQVLSRDYVRLALAACDGLTGSVLPDLRQVMRNLSLQRGRASSRSLVPAMFHETPIRLPPLLEATLIPEREVIQ